MGGADKMEQWNEADPKVAYKDRVHFTDIGYQRWADALSGALLAGYDTWRHAQNLPPSKSVAPATKQAPQDAGEAALPGASGHEVPPVHEP
jgi:hypothetical protein